MQNATRHPMLFPNYKIQYSCIYLCYSVKFLILSRKLIVTTYMVTQHVRADIFKTVCVYSSSKEHPGELCASWSIQAHLAQFSPMNLHVYTQNLAWSIIFQRGLSCFHYTQHVYDVVKKTSQGTYIFFPFLRKLFIQYVYLCFNLVQPGLEILCIQFFKSRWYRKLKHYK